MTAYAWVMRLKPGAFDEYDRHHKAVWPEVLDGIARAGMHDYRIFRHGDLLFGTFSCDDIAHAQRTLRESEANQRWKKVMATLVDADVDPATGMQRLLPLVWEFPERRT